MWIDVVKPVSVRLSKRREVHLDPGNPRYFPDDTARKILEGAPGLARAVELDHGATWTPGDWVEWHSEQFGPCIAQVALPPVARGGWAVVVLKVPSHESGVLIWVRREKVRLISSSADCTRHCGQSFFQL